MDRGGAVVGGAGGSEARLLLDMQVALVVMRLGVLVGMRRAYERPPWSYWFSPLFDLPVALLLIVSALRRRQCGADERW